LGLNNDTRWLRGRIMSLFPSEINRARERRSFMPLSLKNSECQKKIKKEGRKRKSCGALKESRCR